VEELVVGAQRRGGLNDGDLLDLAERAENVAVDSPFGWPADFVLAGTEWAQPGGTWPTAPFERMVSERSARGDGVVR
jgi:hypothetical protein